MDHYPEAILLGEEPGDDDAAERLTQLVRYVLKHRGYRSTFRAKCRSALMKGASVQEVYWDDQLLGGLGDVGVREWDILSFLWDPKFQDIQQGRAAFKIGYYPMEWFARHYPDQARSMRPDRFAPIGERDYVDGGRGDEAMLIEFWQREYLPAENAWRVHMAKLAGGALLEDSRQTRPEGMYGHGLYPFVVEPLYPLGGQPVGLGVVDMLANLQTSADRLDQIIMKNALLSGQLKLLVNRSADIDERSLTDMSAELVRGARVDEGAVRWMQAAPLSGYILNYQQSKLQAIKEESGQNLFNRGETYGGITAASAILALQEAGSKRSRLLIDQLFDGYEQLIRMVIRVIQENYTERRAFRVLGQRDKTLFYGGREDAIDFDLSVRVQKQTAYTTLYQNELALQLLQNGVIAPEDALDMLTFEGKERIEQRRRGATANSDLAAALAAAEEGDHVGGR
ncbi:MAG: hypothetical protein GX558_09100, partial [Clostridiales bacterium]|nr:hypothetical protein [Clostridiales bacterium]